MGDSLYRIYTANIPNLHTLFFGLCGVGIHNVISKNYHMSDITLISKKIGFNIHSHIIKNKLKQNLSHIFLDINVISLM